MDVFDRAEELEAHHREVSIKAQLEQGREKELPDEEDGIRYCLDCGMTIDKERLQARPESVRCVDCKSIKEQRGKR